MIHYHIWFNLRDGCDESESLETIREFLQQLHSLGSIAAFRLFANEGKAARTKLPKLHAQIEFASGEQFGAAFSAQIAQGIHTGLHGRVMSLVKEFQIEVFREIPMPGWSRTAAPAYLQACEI